MTKRKPDLYFNQKTGNITYANKAQAKKLDADWHKVKFVKNEKNEDVMRFSFTDPRGATATVDVKENGEREVAQDVNRDTE